MSTAPPTLNGQILGQAERATRAVLDRLLARTGTRFPEWVALNVATLHGGPIPARTLRDAVAAGLKTPAAAIDDAVAELIGGGLLQPGPDSTLHPSAAGSDRHAEITAGIAAVSTRLYDGIAPTDLAVVGRVLALVTQRADAMLADPEAGDITPAAGGPVGT